MKNIKNNWTNKNVRVSQVALEIKSIKKNLG